MFSFFRHTFRQWVRSGTRTAPARPPARRLQCEALEDRVLLSINTSEALVNTTRTGADIQPATATAANGSSVVVWSVVKSSTDRDVMAQRYDAYGRKVGGEIAVATGRNPQHNPVVAMDAKGDFVIVWVHDYSLTDSDIHGALFRADGSRNGNEFVVAQTPNNEYDPSVAMDAVGNFIVSYTYQFRPSDLDVKAVQFRANGSYLHSINVAVSSRVEDHSDVAASPDGRFTIAYQSLGNVYLSRYSATGVLLGTYGVATSAVTECNPDVAMDGYGNALVVWQQQNGSDWNIMGRSIAANGVMGPTFGVAYSPSAIETLPSVALDAVSGSVLIVFQSQVGSVVSVLASEWTAAHKWIHTSLEGTGRTAPSASMGGPMRRFVVAAQSIGGTSLDPDGGVFAAFGNL